MTIVADLDAELGSRLARLAESVPVAPWLGHVEPSPVAARRQIRMAWLTPLVAILVVVGAVVGPDLLLGPTSILPVDRSIDLWTIEPRAGMICPSARGGGWLIRHERSGLGVTDPSRTQPQAVQWPTGYSARIKDGRAELLAGGDAVIAREGDRVVLGGAGGLEPDGTEYFYACGDIEVVDEQIEPVDGVLDTTIAGDFQLTIRATKARYAPDEPIEISASLTYLGGDESVQLWHGGGSPMAFGIREPVNGLTLSPSWRLSCTPTELVRKGSIEQAFTKSGGFDGTDPHAVEWRAFFDEPRLFLPEGTWHPYVQATFSVGGCGAGNVRFRVQLEIEVRR